MVGGGTVFNKGWASIMFLTDEEMEAIESNGADHSQESALTTVPPVQQQIPLYPLSIANGGAMGGTAPESGLLRKRIVGVPVWAWGLIGVTGAAAGVFYFKSRKTNSEPSVTPNINDALSEPETSDGEWSPSRSQLASKLERYLQKKKVVHNVTVWTDADDAHEKGGIKQVSPLVNIQVKNNGFKADPAFTRYCRREGVNPVQHPDGNIGLYPHSSTKRGKEWESYVDALRDDGQKV